MSNFVRHHPCPKCNSRDNLGEWDDGHFYCFGCGYIQNNSQDNLTAIKKRLSRGLKEDRNNSVLHLPADVTDIIPKEPLEWLRKYGLTFKEIFENNFQWSEKDRLLILDALPDWWQGRTFNSSTYPSLKYLTRGNTAHNYRIFGKNTDAKVVLTEDCISAIKVSRVADAVPLLSSHVPIRAFARFFFLYKEVVVWLDHDKKAAALASAIRGSQFGKCSTVITTLDPKCYSTEEIQEFLGG